MTREGTRARPAGVADVLRTAVRGVRSDPITFIAASLAYYAFVSLVPLLLLGLVVASVVGGPDVVGRVTAVVTATLGDAAGGLVRDALVSSAGRGGATVVGVAVLLWSGLKLFRGLDVAFSTIYGAPLPDSLLVQLRDGVVVLGGVGVGVTATVAVGAGLARTDVAVDVLPGWAVAVAGTLLLLLGLTLALLPLYYVLPARDVSVGEALPGAAFAAVGWTLLQTAFRVYAERAASFEAYGVLGGVLLLVTWLYFGALVLLVGVVLNAALAGRLGPDDVTTELDRVDPTDRAARTDSDPSLMTDDTDADRDLGDRPDEPDGDGLDDELAREIDRLYDEIDRLEARVDERTVHRSEIERELKRYVRRRVRQGKARGWGPYLVLLYGTAMTLGAFYLLSGGWAILAMVVVWLSTLGLYALMLLVGAAVGAVSLPGRVGERLAEFRR